MHNQPVKKSLDSKGTIGSFSDRLNELDNLDRPMSLAEYEENIDEDGKMNMATKNDLGEHLRLIGFLADTSEVPSFAKEMFKEFLLAGLRKIAGNFDPNTADGVDTYEFDIAKFGTFAAYIQTCNIIDEGDKRLITIVVSSSNYPRKFRLTVADRILNYVSSQQHTSKDIQTKIGTLLRQFYTLKNADRIKDIREELIDTNDAMKSNVKKLDSQGEQIRDIIKRSDHLSDKSKIAYNNVRNLNNDICCIQ